MWKDFIPRESHKDLNLNSNTTCLRKIKYNRYVLFYFCWQSLHRHFSGVQFLILFLKHFQYHISLFQCSFVLNDYNSLNCKFHFLEKKEKPFFMIFDSITKCWRFFIWIDVDLSIFTVAAFNDETYDIFRNRQIRNKQMTFRSIWFQVVEIELFKHFFRCYFKVTDDFINCRTTFVRSGLISKIYKVSKSQRSILNSRGPSIDPCCTPSIMSK